MRIASMELQKSILSRKTCESKHCETLEATVPLRVRWWRRPSRNRRSKPSHLPRHPLVFKSTFRARLTSNTAWLKLSKRSLHARLPLKLQVEVVQNKASVRGVLQNCKSRWYKQGLCGRGLPNTASWSCENGAFVRDFPWKLHNIYKRETFVKYFLQKV